MMTTMNATFRQVQHSKKWNNIVIKEYRFGVTWNKLKRLRKNKILTKSTIWSKKLSIKKAKGNDYKLKISILLYINLID